MTTKYSRLGSFFKKRLILLAAWVVECPDSMALESYIT